MTARRAPRVLRFAANRFQDMPRRSAWRRRATVPALLAALALSAPASRAKEPVVTGYHLKPAEAAVMVGKSLELKLVYCDVDASGGGSAPADDELAPLPVLRCEDDPDSDGRLKDLTPLVKPKEVTWEVSSGPGTVSGDLEGATYRAPASKPQPNEATVSATVTYHVGTEKTILLSRITILDQAKAYRGKFRSRDVFIGEYTHELSGDVTFDFATYYDIGGWREYEGKGTATYSVRRVGCSTAAFSGVPVEGRLKVHDDGRYEFEVGLVSEEERVTTCHLEGIDWQEEQSPAGVAMHSGDPCATDEFFPRYESLGELSLARNGSCPGSLDSYSQDWSFRAIR